MSEKDITQYEYLWTTELEDHALFTIKCYGCDEYVVYHIPTKQVRFLRYDAVGQQIIKNMIKMGVKMLDKSPKEILH